MPKQYARFASSPIGPSLVAQNGGLVLTTSAATPSLARTARSDVSQSSGQHGVEFTFYGDDSLNAAIGVCQPGSSLSVGLGGEASSISWLLHLGEVYIGGGLVASGLPSVAKGDVVGVRIDIATTTIEFYKGTTLVHSRSLPASGATWHFAASLHSPGGAGKLACAVNAGQWQAVSAAGQKGWQPAPGAISTVRLADWDWITAGTDTPAHARYEGGLDGDNFSTVAEMGFWPWSSDPPMQGGAAQLAIIDPDGLLDALAQQDVSGLPVAIRLGDLDGTLATATAVARFVCDRIEVQGDNRKTIYLRDAHDDLDEPLTRGVFLPSIPALAWRVQPVVIGAVASVPALTANSDGSVAWLADAPLAEVATVLDRGDAMEAGTWTLTPDKQQLLLSQPPVGPIVVDASSIGVGMQPATLEQTLREVFRRGGKASWSAADAAAIDAATGYAGIGYYAGDAIPVRQALAAILPSYGAWFWQTADGLLRFTRVVDPASVAPGALAFDLDLEAEGVEPEVIPDDAARLTRRMAYRPNARVLAPSELVTDMVDVPAWRRDELTAPWRGQAYSAKPLAPRYVHADTAAPLVSCFWRSQDAQTEIDRVCAIYGTQRQSYVVPLDALSIPVPLPGQVGRISYPRFGLTAGKQVLVRRVTRSPGTGAVNLVLWG